MSSKNIPVSIAGAKQEGLSKMSRNRARFDTSAQRLPKPAWIRVRLPTGNAVAKLKSKLRANHLSSVCEEASCPNIHECFSKGTATFMILGEVCTRRCSFCDVAHGRPLAVDDAEPENLARTVADMGLRYVVVTSVDRDDLRDGGAAHFARCIIALRAACPQIRIEILTPDFRGKGRLDAAMTHLSAHPPDVFNHNVETVSSLYPNVRPGADYQWSLNLLKAYKALNPGVISKSGIMLGLGEDMNQIQSCLHDLRAHDVEMLTVGQYLQPTRHHHPVLRYWTPQAFEEIAVIARSLGFSHVASGPMVRSSYHADLSAGQSGLLLENG